MPENSSAPSIPNREEVEFEERSLEDIGLDPQLSRALTNMDLQNPTPIQRVTAPLILDDDDDDDDDDDEDEETGLEKTLAYLLPLLHKVLSRLESNSSNVSGPAAFILVPNTELIQQVYSEFMSLIEFYKVELKVAQLTSSMSYTELKQALSGPPDVLVSTPGCVHKCLSVGALQPEAIQESLPVLILDEAHLLLSHDYEDDLRAVMSHVSRRCQCLLMSAASSDDLVKLKKLILHKPYLLTLPEEDCGNNEIIPNSVDHFWICCAIQDKYSHLVALLDMDLVLKKVLLFTNTIEMGFWLKLFLEKCAISSAFLNAELPLNSRLRIIEEFNAGSFDCLIAIADGETNIKEQEAAGKNDAEIKKAKKWLRQKLDTEYGVMEGIDFKNVCTVINFHMPSTAEGYIHRIGRTGPRTSIFLISPDEMKVLGELECTLAEHSSGRDIFAPFPSLKRREVVWLRYRAEAIVRTMTRDHVLRAWSEAIPGTKFEDEVETWTLRFILKP